MFKELLSLWLTQKQRAFSWRTFFVGLFLALYFVGIVVGTYFGVRESLAEFKPPFELAAIVPLMAVAIIPADLLIKIFWRHSPVEMDDYIRTRPVTHKTWTLFILFDTCMGGLQWLLPCCMAFVVAIFLPLWTAPVVLLLALSCSIVNALFQNCWRRAPGNQWTLPLVPSYMLWLLLAYGIAVACMFAVSSSSSSLWLSSSLLLFLNVGAAKALLWYFGRLRNHNEEQHLPVHTTARSLGDVSLWSIEWVQILRSKRLRVSVITIAVVFILNTYLQQQTASQQLNGLNIMLLFGIGFPSIILAQWVFGIEANFFSGVWTKPWSVQDILRRKYYFFCALCAIMALLILPCVIFMGMSFWIWISTFLFACGVLVLPFMATCLYSSRMDLFASAFFNYQGGNKQLNIFSFVMFIPIGIYFAAYFLLPQPWSHLAVSALGIIGFMLHRPYIHFVSTRWFTRRYDIMERWLSE